MFSFISLLARAHTHLVSLSLSYSRDWRFHFLGIVAIYRADSFQAREASTSHNSRVSKNEGAELWCASWEGQIHTWFTRALLIWSTSTSYDHKRDLPSFL